MTSLRVLTALALLSATPACAAPDAVTLLFGEPFLSRVAPGTTLVYDENRRSEIEAVKGGESTVTMAVSSGGKTETRNVTAEVTGPERARTLDFDGMSGNPVVMIFLEQDVSDMARLLGGSPFYLRNRIRAAIGTGAVAETRFDFDGRPVEGWSVTLTPFIEDPNAARLRDYARKRYEFLVSNDVPGGVFQIRSTVPRQGGEGALVEDVLTLSSSGLSKDTR